MASKTNPPLAEKRAHRFSTSSRTWPGVPNGSVRWVSTPPPQKVSRSPYLFLRSAGSMPAADTWTGLMMSNPLSMKCAMNGSTAPQECLNVFQAVCAWIHAFTRW